MRARFRIGRVLLTGLSNGCAMVQRLTAEASYLVDATACASFYLLVKPLSTYAPVSVMEVHGFQDIVVPYNRSVYGTDALANFERWSALNGCVDDVNVTWLASDLERRSRSSCRDNTSVTLLTNFERSDSSHRQYVNENTVKNLTANMWAFLDEHSSAAR